MRSDEVEKGNPTLLGRVYLATFLFARPCLIPKPWERSAGRRPSRSDWSRTKNRRGTTQHKSYRTSKTCVFSNPRTATWVRCSGRHVLAPVLTKIHAREASRHVHSGALMSVSSGGSEWSQLRGEHKVTQLALFFGPGERFASAMIICEPSSNQHPPLRTRKEPCGSRKAVRPSSRGDVVVSWTRPRISWDPGADVSII